MGCVVGSWVLFVLLIDRTDVSVSVGCVFFCLVCLCCVSVVLVCF